MRQVKPLGYGTRHHDGYRDQSEDPQKSSTNDFWDYRDQYDDQRYQPTLIPYIYGGHQRLDTHQLFLANAGDSEEEYATMGGPIKSPSNSVNCRLAWDLRVSYFDAATLGDRDYNGGVDGFDLLTITIIKNCGYLSIFSDDVILCYRDIMQLHCKTLGSWVNAWILQSSPLVKRVVEKALPLFKKLEGITAVELFISKMNSRKLQVFTFFHSCLLMPSVLSWV
jgi:hypothetical protein